VPTRVKYFSGPPLKGRLIAVSQTLGQAGKAHQGQTSSLLQKVVAYGRKKFYNSETR